MLFDILIAVAITIVAIVLGIAVHPWLLFILVFAVIYLFARHGSRRSRMV
jgi:hypothetical protein